MKPKTILAIDKPGWAFHNIASVIADYFKADFNFAIVFGQELKNEKADILIALKWNALPIILADNTINKVICCLYDHVTWCNNHDDQFIFSEYALKQSDLLTVSNMHIMEMIRTRGFDKLPVFITEDGVNCGMFKPTPLPEQFVLGWCGNASHGAYTIKGLDLIEEACNITGTELLIRDTTIGNKVLGHKAMPAWYSRISAYCCASKNEGGPNPPLEAMACGRPVISTRMGIMDRLINHGSNGYFVERTVESLAHYIEKLKKQDVATMGAIARQSALVHDWRHKLMQWKVVLDAAKVLL